MKWQPSVLLIQSFDDAARLSHANRLRLMAAIDDLLLPWTVDLALRHELPPDLLSHVQRVGRCLWTRSQ